MEEKTDEEITVTIRTENDRWRVCVDKTGGGAPTTGKSFTMRMRLEPKGTNVLRGTCGHGHTYIFIMTSKDDRNEVLKALNLDASGHPIRERRRLKNLLQ